MPYLSHSLLKFSLFKPTRNVYLVNPSELPCEEDFITEGVSSVETDTLTPQELEKLIEEVIQAAKNRQKQAEIARQIDEAFKDRLF